MLQAATHLATLRKTEDRACLLYLPLAINAIFIARQVPKRVSYMCNFIFNLCHNRTALRVAEKNCLVKKPFIVELLQPKATFRAPLVNKFANLSVRENLVVTSCSANVHTSLRPYRLWGRVRGVPRQPNRGRRMPSFLGGKSRSAFGQPA